MDSLNPGLQDESTGGGCLEPRATGRILWPQISCLIVINSRLCCNKECLEREKTSAERNTKIENVSSCCGLVGRAVTSNTFGLQFESSHQRYFKDNTFPANMYYKNENKEKSPRIVHFLKINRMRNRIKTECILNGRRMNSKWTYFNLMS